jgi:hypothetical protein
MCRFLAAIVLKNGDIICQPEYTNSHADLIRAVKLRDDKINPDFARVEYTPPEDLSKIEDLNSWSIKLDEKIKPSWFDSNVEHNVILKLSARVKSMFIKDERELLLGGCYILLGNSRVKKAKNVSIKFMLDNSQIERLLDNSHIDSLWGNSRIKILQGNSQILNLYDNSWIGYLLDNSQIWNLWDKSHVVNLWDTSQIINLRDNSQVDNLYDNSRIINDYRNK